MTITNTIRDVDETEWKALVGDDIIEQSHGWFKTIEDSHMRDMQYVFVKDETLKAAACCYVYPEELYITIPLLEVRSPLANSAGFFSKDPYYTDMLVKGLTTIQEKEKARGLSFLEMKKKDLDSIKPHLKGFIEFPVREDTYLDLDFADFDDYLASLDSTSRRSIRKTLNRASKRWKINTVFTNEFSQWKTIASQLRENLCEEHNNYRQYLPEEFYEALGKNLKDNAELIMCFKDKIPLVCGLILNSPTVTQHKFAGINPQYREYQAYFLVYYEGIKKAIERKQKRIYFGPTTYEFKEKIGCKRENVFGLAKLTNPLLHLALASYITTVKLRGKKL
jgi:predicted N-acyltransferase